MIESSREKMILDELSVWIPYFYSSSTPPFPCVLSIECAYFARHVRKALRNRPYINVVDRVPNNHELKYLALTEYEEAPWDDVFTGRAISNNICIRKGLSRKAQFSKYMAKHISKCPACPLTSIIPYTLVVDTMGVFHDRPSWLDLPSALSEALVDVDEAVSNSPGSFWILKPSMANKGAEVFIVKEVDEVETVLKTWKNVGQWVFQKYMSSPLLICKAPLENGKRSHEGHKFHLRVYCLLNGAAEVFVLNEALVLLAVQPYLRDQIENRFSHITNTCVGSESISFDADKHVKTLSELGTILVEDGTCSSTSDAAKIVDQIYTDIKTSIHHVFAGLEGEFNGLQALPSAFELYGVDFLVDEKFYVHLLEFNPTPDVKQTGDRLDYIIENLTEDMFRKCVDPRIAAKGKRSLEPIFPHFDLVYSKEWKSNFAAGMSN
jgi:tubulin---tyrosine ligase